jgi:4-hydroxy-3-methylbut-2-en-1-yl diphosphate reductase
MTSPGKFVVITALRSEYAALFNQVPGADLERCGMGPDRVREWLPRLHALNPDIVAVAGVAGGLDPSLRPGDVIVASEVRDEHGRIVLRAAAPLAAELRRLGLRVHTGPIASTDHIVHGAARERLAESGALAVDMESAAIVRALHQQGLPIAVVRVIVDTMHSPLHRLTTVPAGARALRVLRQAGPALRRWADLAGERTVLLAAPRSTSSSSPCAGTRARSMCAARSFTTRTWSPIFSVRVRYSLTSSTRCQTEPRWSFPLTVLRRRFARRPHGGV